SLPSSSILTPRPRPERRLGGLSRLIRKSRRAGSVRARNASDVLEARLLEGVLYRLAHRHLAAAFPGLLELGLAESRAKRVDVRRGIGPPDLPPDLVHVCSGCLPQRRGGRVDLDCAPEIPARGGEPRRHLELVG